MEDAMKQLLVACSLVALLSASLYAQDTTKKPRANGYFFVSPGVWNDTGDATFLIGGGGEAFIYRGLGFGVDLGAMHSPNWSSWAAILSINALYGIKLPTQTKLLPFVTFGLAATPQFDTPGDK